MKEVKIPYSPYSPYKINYVFFQAALRNINLALAADPSCLILLATRSLCYLELELWQVRRGTLSVG